MDNALDLFAMASCLIEETHSKKNKADASVFYNLINRQDLPSEDSTTLSVGEFKKRYEDKALPVCLLSCTLNWKIKNLSLPVFLRNFGSVEFSLYGGQKFLFSEYMQYLSKCDAETLSPLYLFDDLSSPNQTNKSQILGYYSPPKYFHNDIFETEDVARRPPYRWILIGPTNSGTKLHIDPFFTSAWNTLVQGRKRWIVFSFELKSELDKILGVDLTTLTLLQFFDIWNKLGTDFFSKNEGKLYDFIQKETETIFIPAQWWHIVVNLETSVCLTQNYAPPKYKNEVIESLKTMR
eukprot:maker-scaffold_9-snap-gene-0.1-mRNA-1 protein AED:0.00 eAED:0.00 QI:93/1/1/1/0/0.5/2/317/293